MHSFKNSSGSKENDASGPYKSLESVKCFSITQAPKAAAAIDVASVMVWSLKPTFTLNFFLKTSIKLRPDFSGGHGYIELHWSK